MYKKYKHLCAKCEKHIFLLTNFGLQIPIKTQKPVVKPNITLKRKLYIFWEIFMILRLKIDINFACMDGSTKL